MRCLYLSHRPLSAVLDLFCGLYRIPLCRCVQLECEGGARAACGACQREDRLPALLTLGLGLVVAGQQCVRGLRRACSGPGVSEFAKVES